MVQRRRYRGGSGARKRLLGSLSLCILLVPTTLAAATPRSPAATVVDAAEVRSILTGEFGVAQPTGLAYVRTKNVLLVAATGRDRTRLLRLGPFEDALGTLKLPKISNPSTLSFDPLTARLTAVDGKKRVTVRSSDLSSAAPKTERTDIRSLRLEDPQGATFDPASGAWLVLDSGAREIVRVSSSGEASAKPVRLSLKKLGAGRLRGLSRNPVDGLLYVASPDRDLLFAVDRSGRARKTYNIKSARIRNLRALVFAPSADRTDPPGTQHVYIADAGSTRAPGRVIEISLARPVELAKTVEGSLVQTIHTSRLGTPAPDPAGISYAVGSDTLMFSDSEVDEMSIYRGVNLFSLTRRGALVDTGTTHSFSREPTGVGFDASTGTLYTSDDVKDTVFIARPGPDGRHGTPDDAVTTVSTASFGSLDPEGVEFDPESGHLFVADGSGQEIYDVNPVNGAFGDGDDTVTHFDVGRYGIRNCEGIGSDTQRDTLLVVDDYERKIFELTRTGKLVRIINIPVAYADLWLAGVTAAPTSNPSDSPNAMSYWIADRHVDNNADPNENDGRIYEVLRP